MNPRCPRSAEFRGLCSTCYTEARKRIKTGKLSWAELERLGGALPSKRTASTAADWLDSLIRKKK